MQPINLPNSQAKPTGFKKLLSDKKSKSGYLIVDQDGKITLRDLTESNANYIIELHRKIDFLKKRLIDLTFDKP